MSEIFNKDSISWKDYYITVKDRPPRETLLTALSFFEKESRNSDKLFAIDVGCGSGTDTGELLNKGWKVLAIDKEEIAIELLQNKFNDYFNSGRLITKAESFENLNLQTTDFINASYCLPFCHPEHFKNLWDKINKAIKLNGRFAGNFFGEKDEWSKSDDMTFHPEKKVREMFENYEIEFFHERDEDGETADGNKKHWHVFSVVAKKIM